jgi:hypothetical protein
MLAGTGLVFVSLASHFSPSPNAYKAENDAQAAGMQGATILMVLVGLFLVGYSFKPRKPQSLEMISQNNSAQDGT